MLPVFEVFPALHGPHDDQRIRFFWALLDPTRDVLLRSGTGFSTRTDARADALAVKAAATAAAVRDGDRPYDGPTVPAGTT